MKVTIYGTGYVGLVTGVCLAELGNDVVCMDIDTAKIDQLNRGVATIFEEGLSERLQQNLSANRLRFTTSFSEGVAHGLFQFIAVGTPATVDGMADLSAVHAVARQIGQLLTNYCLVITKSTVPVGTADVIATIIREQLQQRQMMIDFDIASNPEFLREGQAINDFLNPDRIVVGADNDVALDYLRELYMPLIDAGKRFIAMNTRSSELTKYASNAFLATKISFMNEMSLLAERLGADIDQVKKGMSMDPRIGEHFLNAGCGYGGSCFPKDIQALKRTAQEFDQPLRIISATEAVNQDQKMILINKLNHYFKGQIENKTIALWGLSFKPNTDDMREASSRVIIEYLLQHGVTVQAYDPVAGSEAEKLYGQQMNFQLRACQNSALENADALMIVTEWDTFRYPNFAVIKERLRYPVIFDGRNLYDPAQMVTFGLNYYAIGRGHSLY